MDTVMIIAAIFIVGFLAWILWVVVIRKYFRKRKSNAVENRINSRTGHDYLDLYD